MKIVLQRVKEASVFIEAKEVSRINQGLLLLLGIEKGDREADADYLASKVLNLRVFEDKEAKINLSVSDIKGEIMVVSQFTLLADCNKGHRPSFDRAAPKEVALGFYNYFIKKMSENADIDVKAGEFGAKMEVNLINDGPVTIILDSKRKR